MAGPFRRGLAASLTCAAAAFVAAMSMSSTDAQGGAAPVAIVDRITGLWRVPSQGMRELEPQDLLYSGQTVLIDRSTSASIEVVFFAGGQRWEKACAPAAPCEGSYRPAVPAQPSTLARFWSFFAEYWQPARPAPPEIMGSRSVGPTGPTHTLLVRTGTSADLWPALARLKSGSYVVVLRRAGGATVRDAATLTIQLAAERPQPVGVSLGTGLYSLTVQTPSGENIGAPAIVLVGQESDTALLESWNAARLELAGWKDVSPATTDAMLARTLYALAELRVGQ